ncbi:hypothetical protein E3U44_11395 [Nitrosococcus wardiae]|uniref:Uncharacterized protein n=1 Tax=Nitrosococcus wardiae TaxID=1814290 RepID=A0A4P7C0F1_9GAMM|nr:hypothetical protein E3U44_11395 [Nitrosococcus wardiae]
MLKKQFRHLANFVDAQCAFRAPALFALWDIRAELLKELIGHLGKTGGVHRPGEIPDRPHQVHRRTFSPDSAVRSPG